MNARELTVWSLLMASAHGAGLMVVPFVMDASNSASGTIMRAEHMAHATHAASALSLVPDPHAVALVATLVHSVGYSP